MKSEDIGFAKSEISLEDKITILDEYVLCIPMTLKVRGQEMKYAHFYGENLSSTEHYWKSRYRIVTIIVYVYFQFEFGGGSDIFYLNAQETYIIV